MKKTYMYAIVVIVAVAIGAAVWYGLSHKSAPSSTNSMNMDNSNNSSSNSSSQTPAATNAVTIQNFAFSPANITVKAGTKVTWTNNDSVAHTVTETDGKTGPASSDVNPGETYSFTFSTPGTYQYYCSIHQSMLGTVVVTE